MTRTGISLIMTMAWTLSACGHQAGLEKTAVVRTIQISDLVTPNVVYAKSGEEIRWENLRANPVRVGFLTDVLLEELGCKKGVDAFFEGVGDVITIEPGESASLCPLRSGVLQYNVWFDPENPKGAISPTASIHVEAVGASRSSRR